MAYYQKRGNGYRLIKYCGYVQGKKIYQYKTIYIDETLPDKKKEKELQKQLILFEQETEENKYLDSNKITFEKLANLWWEEYAKKELAPSTLHAFKPRLFERIIPAIGHIKLSQLQPHHLMQFYNNLSEKNVRKNIRFQIHNNIFMNHDLQKISDELHITKRTLQKIKNGGLTNKETAKKIAKYFKKPLSKIFTSPDKEKSLSSQTIAHHHSLISSILSYAVTYLQILDINIAKNMKPPKVKKEEENYYDIEEVSLLLEKLEQEPLKYKVMIYLDLTSGIRLSELSALKWSDIDFSKSMLSITSERQYISELGIIEKPPKTKSGIRTITLPQATIDILKQYKIYQSECRLKMGSKWIDTNYIFTNDIGQPLFPNRPSVWFHNFIRKYNLPPLTFHQLRHTNASILLSKGIALSILSKRLGHSKVGTTLNLYVHALPSEDKLAAEKFDVLFESNLKTKKY